MNGEILTPYRTISKKCLVIDSGVIAGIIDEASIDPSLPIIDARGGYISPGFIDIHVHGGGGYDFMDGSEEAFVGPAVAHARHGTTALSPTTVACDHERLKHFIAVYESVHERSSYLGADLVGIHIEGPYLAQSQRGAQDGRNLSAPDPREYAEILSLTKHIVRWDAAPELPGVMEFGDALVRSGVLPSIAHSDAVFEEAMEALEHGFSHVTHFYSGTSTVTRVGPYRKAGVVEFGYLRDDVTVEIIADGCHLPASLLGLIYKVKGPSRVALITDAMRAAGTQMTTARLGDATQGLDVIIEDGVAKLPDRSSFAGSVATADRLVRNMVHLAGVPLNSAVQMMTITPARILGIKDRKGIIAPGYDADIVVFDQNVQVTMTMVRGTVVFEKS